MRQAFSRLALERNQLTAATTIIERALGKPQQPITGKDGEPAVRFIIETTAKVTDG